MSEPKTRLQEAHEVCPCYQTRGILIGAHICRSDYRTCVCLHDGDPPCLWSGHAALDAAVEEARRDPMNTEGMWIHQSRVDQMLAVEKARADAAEFQVKALLERSHDCNAAEKALAERTAELAAIRATLDVAKEEVAERKRERDEARARLASPAAPRRRSPADGT